LAAISSLNVGDGDAMLLASVVAVGTHFDGLRVVHAAAVFLETVEVFVVVACASALSEDVL
jgi:hypothetical protein